MEEIAKQKKQRDYAAERRAAGEKKAMRVAFLADDRNTGKLGDEVIKIAQAMILCTLPYRATEKNKITRSARLGDGSTLYVTFTAGMRDVSLPFGADRKLLAWIFDRAISSNSPFIPWNSAAEYQDEIGQSRGGKNNRELRERFRRISGLVISIERKTQTALNPIAKAHNTSVATVSLAWVLAKPFVTSVIIGAKRPDQLQQNLAAADLELTADEIKQLDEVSALPPEYPGWMLPFQNANRLADVPRS